MTPTSSGFGAAENSRRAGHGPAAGAPAPRTQTERDAEDAQ
ncbi:hypothetical protein [Streptomyces sp. NPDC002133]